MILRLSEKLNKKIGAGTLSTLPPDENPYADWSCHLFTADRTQYIIMSNTKSLYSCVIYGAGITDDSRFMQRDPTVFVRGAVSHADHATIHLGGWHRVAMNTENQSRAMASVAFLD